MQKAAYAIQDKEIQNINVFILCLKIYKTKF